MRQSGCVQCATPTSCVYCEAKSSWRMLPTQYMQTFVKHTSDASTKESVQLSILWNNYHANGTQLRKFATREPRCCETSVARLAARWRIAGHLGRTSPYPRQPLQNICQRIVRILLGILLFSFGFGFFGILATGVSWWLVRHLAQILNLKMNSKQLGLQSTTHVKVLYLFTVPISSELFFCSACAPMTLIDYELSLFWSLWSDKCRQQNSLKCWR